MTHALILPMAAHVALVMVLYGLLTVARAPAVWGIGRGPDGGNPWATVEPRISANLSNQFEWPLFFHVACLLSMQSSASANDHALVVIAWMFIGGRLLHSGVQILVPNLRLRGLVFMINFLAVLGLWALLVLPAIAGISP